MWRGTTLILVFPLLAVTCRGEVAELPTCTSSVTQEPTGDLGVDLVGVWEGHTDEADWHHPIAYMATVPGGAGTMGDRIWMFRSDGTGYVWYVVNEESGSYSNDEEFDWEVVDGRILVNDLPRPRWTHRMISTYSSIRSTKRSTVEGAC